MAGTGDASRYGVQELAGFKGPVETVAIGSLLLTDSPRLTAHDAAHVQVMAAVAERLPPVVVHRPSMRVIDGVHRVLAHQLRGEASVAVRFFDGSSQDAFLLSVQSNIAHGLPLSLAEREAAAARIVLSHATWSDRAIARAVGLSATTVAAIRRCSTDDSRQSNVRIGRDGRARPLDIAAGRIRASQVIAARPDASIREVAREAGVSIGTAHDVRTRLSRGLAPVPASQSAGATEGQPARRSTPRQERVTAADTYLDILERYQRIRRDPSLRHTENGRSLIRKLDACMFEEEGWRALINAVPPHQATDVADLARSLAAQWQKLADELNCRSVTGVS